MNRTSTRKWNRALFFTPRGLYRFATAGSRRLAGDPMPSARPRFPRAPVCSFIAYFAASLALHAANFVAPADLDFKALLPAPPAADSLTTRAELETLVQLQHDRTPAQTELARNPPTGDVFAFATAVLGPWFTKENLPQTAALFARIDDDGRAIATAAKSIHPERRRPFLVDPRISDPTSRPGGSTYPSGAGYHTAVWTAILVTLFSEQAEALRTRARLACWSRVVAGVHYPTDNAAGQFLGEAVARKFLALPAGKSALAEIRTELARVRKK